MKASLNNYRQSPRKVRTVANLIKGKKIADAELQLSFLAKRSSLPIKTLLMSAVANAGIQGFTPEILIVKNVRVDKGLVMKRMMPRARGSAYRINKRTSHVIVELALIAPKKEKETPTETKKEAPKKKSPVAKKAVVKKPTTK